MCQLDIQWVMRGWMMKKHGLNNVGVGRCGVTFYVGEFAICVSKLVVDPLTRDILLLLLYF
jgi:hypothetical protein